MLSTLHEASEIVSKQYLALQYHDRPSMNLADHSDHMLSTYVTLKGNKW